MTYAVKEIYATLQGEGAQAGRTAVFCRFAGCNLWSGREEDRHSAICSFCDTDFVGTDGVGGGRFTSASRLVRAIGTTWPSTDRQNAYVVFTGGEPALQLDAELVGELRDEGFEVAVETNGTLELPEVDWLCVSPKAGAELVVRRGDELKLVYPQQELDPSELVELDFDHFFLQPMDGDRIEENVRATVEYCLEHPQWRLSLQSHKLIGLP